MSTILDWLAWNLWQKWAYRWKHRNDTLEEARAEMYRRWGNYLETMKDEPAGVELHDAMKRMEDIKKSFGDE